LAQGRFLACTRQNGLADNVVYSLIEDDAGFVWMDYGSGLFRIPKQQLSDYGAGRIQRLSGNVYDTLDGVKSVDKIHLTQPSAAKTADGRLWFAGSRGLTVVDPSKFKTNSVPPPVLIESVIIDKIPMKTGQAGIAAPGRGQMEFHFTAHSLAVPERVLFEYQLEGFDLDWVEAGQRRVAYYTNIKPGRYRFRVIACNNDGIWNEAGASYEFELQPHFHQTNAFYVLCALSCVLLGLAIYLSRVRQLKQRHRVLEKLVRSRTVELSRQSEELSHSNASLKAEVAERKRLEVEKERIHKELLTTSRQAGMAEVATGVLHNVGNVLNSVNVAATLIADKTKNSRISSLAKLDDLLSQHPNDLADFITRDAKGRQIPSFVKSLSECLQQERAEVLGEVASLTHNIDHIKEIVAMQQNYAQVSGVVEVVPVQELVGDALRMHSGAYLRHAVRLERAYAEVPPITTDKHKVLQILVNVLHNAMYACDESGRADKQVAVRIGRAGEDRVRIEVADNGIGIPAENLTKIFNHGFTTRKDGHGFGLHSGALAAKELGGSLTVHSEGLGKGASFTLELPLRNE
jgi:signal transduction histidine kinase